MPDLRKDPIVGRWVIISTARSRRPVDYKTFKNEYRYQVCPLCAGQEDKTPSEVLAYRHQGGLPNGPGWTLRVVPNKFPALMVEGSLDREGLGIYDKMNGVGAHEVVIETPEHRKILSAFSEKEFEDLLWAYRDRILDLKKDSRFRYIMIFKNYGEPAGASLEHSHSQLIALPVIPTVVIEEMIGAKSHFEEKERCIFCDIIRQEIMDGSRLVAENQEFVAITPFASRFPFEVWILPKRHASSFQEGQKSQYEALAKIFLDVLRRLNKALMNPPFNFILHTAPLQDKAPDDYYHWHFEIMPTLTQVAGFEWGTGFYINPTPPEEAAQFLREITIP
ncbi:MAG: galactose-1-phosphate uridylyltransferase [Leptospirillia bacterium]